MSCTKYVTAMIALCLPLAACGIETSLDTADLNESPDDGNEDSALIEQEVPGTPALAEDCGGNLIFRKAAIVGGTVVGELVVYYNSSNGNNCARFNHLGPSYGVTKYTDVQLKKCSTTSPGSGCGTVLDIDYNFGQFAYHAGPVRVYAPRNCVTASGLIAWNGSDHIVSTNGVIGC